MKLKTLIASVCMLCLGYTASAQIYGGSSKNNSGGGITYGVRIGATIANINSDPEDGADMGSGEIDIKSTTGIQVGALANFYINEVLSIQPEILYIQKGSKAMYKEEESFPEFKYYGEGEVELKTNYIEVPVLAKANFGTGNFNFFFTAGPTVGYWLSGIEKADFKATYTDGIDTYEESESSSDDVEFDDDTKRFEVGASIGLGLGYKLGTGALNFDVRYGLGLTDIYTTEGDEQAKNRVIGVSLAYIFGK